MTIKYARSTAASPRVCNTTKEAERPGALIFNRGPDRAQLQQPTHRRKEISRGGGVAGLGNHSQTAVEPKIFEEPENRRDLGSMFYFGGSEDNTTKIGNS